MSQRRMVEMKVLFQLVDKNTDMQEILYEMEIDSEDESISDFEQEMQEAKNEETDEEFFE